jgi:hypothetical protein
MNKFRHIMAMKSFSTKPAPKVRMSNSEAFVETLVANNVNSCFGIVGSAFMDALDLFPSAGIRFVPVVLIFLIALSPT